MDMPSRLTVRCAACSKLLGSVSNEGWIWTRGPARIVNRRRLIEERDAVGSADELPAAPPDDFRLRTVENIRETMERGPGSPDGSVRGPLLVQRRFRLWEYPYTCDSDACMNALGPEWDSKIEHGAGSAEPFKMMPAGRTLS